MPAEALEVVRAWGFTLKTMKGFTWHKTTKHGKSHFGMGHWTRANTEDCLIAVRGKPKRANADVRQFIEAPRGRHSAKPDEVRERLVRLMGDVPRLELFAREAAPGWDVWGNEVESIIAVLKNTRVVRQGVQRGAGGEDMTQPIPINTIEVVRTPRAAGQARNRRCAVGDKYQRITSQAATGRATEAIVNNVTMGLSLISVPLLSLRPRSGRGALHASRARA